MLLLYSKWRGSDPFLMIRDFPFLCGRFEVLTPYRFSWGGEPQKLPSLSVPSFSQAVCGQVQRPGKRHEMSCSHLPFFFFLEMFFYVVEWDLLK